MKVYTKELLGYTKKQVFLCPKCFKKAVKNDDKASWSKVKIYPEKKFVCRDCGKKIKPFEIK